MYVTTVFAGFPCGLNGINAAREVFQEKGVCVGLESPSPYDRKTSRRECGLQAVRYVPILDHLSRTDVSNDPRTARCA